MQMMHMSNYTITTNALIYIIYHTFFWYISIMTSKDIFDATGLESINIEYIKFCKPYIKTQS